MKVLVENDFEISYNAVMKEIILTVKKVAASDIGILIIGENGTGKEWLARAIHNLSQRANAPFYPVDCATLPPEELERELFGFEQLSRDGVTIHRGAFEEANNGTLLLNEINSLSASIQTKVTRAIEYKTIHRMGNDQSIQINARIIATLNQHSEQQLREDFLQKNMFYRISPIIIELPPLRNRREDIPLLIEKFLTELQKNEKQKNILGISPEAIHLCIKYNWPGNIRHLKNAIEYAIVMCSGQWIQPDDLPCYLH